MWLKFVLLQLTEKYNIISAFDCLSQYSIYCYNWKYFNFLAFSVVFNVNHHELKGGGILRHFFLIFFLPYFFLFCFNKSTVCIVNICQIFISMHMKIVIVVSILPFYVIIFNILSLHVYFLIQKPTDLYPPKRILNVHLIFIKFIKNESMLLINFTLITDQVEFSYSLRISFYKC